MIARILLLAVVAWPCGSQILVAKNARRGNYALPPSFSKLISFHTELGKPQPGDWLDRHKETRQTYREYVASRPIRADLRHRVIYVQPLGTFTASQRKIITATTEMLQVYFQLPAKVLPDLPLSIIPKNARRKHPKWGDKQILSTYVLNHVLQPRLPHFKASERDGRQHGHGIAALRPGTRATKDLTRSCQGREARRVASDGMASQQLAEESMVHSPCCSTTSLLSNRRAIASLSVHSQPPFASPEFNVQYRDANHISPIRQ